MVYFETSEEWQRQSSLLLQARPTTTRITTKYKIPNLDEPKYNKAKKRKREAEAEGGEQAPRVPQASLILKTYDPESGVCLKFKTNRAAEVGRLITGLGKVGRYMAALPEKEDAQDIAMEDATEQTTEAASASTPATDVKPQQGAGGGGKKKKKNKK